MRIYKSHKVHLDLANEMFHLLHLDWLCIYYNYSSITAQLQACFKNWPGWGWGWGVEGGILDLKNMDLDTNIVILSALCQILGLKTYFAKWRPT